MSKKVSDTVEKKVASENNDTASLSTFILKMFNEQVRLKEDADRVFAESMKEITKGKGLIVENSKARV